MALNQNIYRIPGSYITESANPALANVSIGFNTTGIIGVGRTWKLISNEELTKSEPESGSADKDTILLQDGTPAVVGDILEIVGIGKISGYNNYVLNTDYSINADKTEITWLSSNKPAVGSTFYITYKLNKSSTRGDYLPKRYYSQSDIIEEFGPEYLDNVIQPITLAGNLLLESQTLFGGGVVLCQVTEDTEAAYKVAIKKMVNTTINTLIILKQDSATLRSYLIEHIMECSSDLFKKERTTFIQPINNEDTLDTMAAQRSGLNNDRVTFFCDTTCNITLTDANTGNETVKTLPIIYLICALSGLEGNPEFGPEEPMLNKQMPSRVIFEDSDGQIKQPGEMVFAGSNYLSYFSFDENTYRIKVGDLFTTKSDNVLSETRAVRKVGDVIRRSLRSAWDKSIVGRINFDSITSDAATVTDTCLDNLKKTKTIKNYKDIVAQLSSTNPKIVQVKYWWLPLLEVKWVYGEQTYYY